MSAFDPTSIGPGEIPPGPDEVPVPAETPPGPTVPERVPRAPGTPSEPTIPAPDQP